MEPVTINFCINQVKFFRNYLQFLLTMGLVVPCGCFRKAKEKMPGWSLKLKQALIKVNSLCQETKVQLWVVSTFYTVGNIYLSLVTDW